MMNRLMMAIAVVTSLSVIQSCSTPLKTMQPTTEAKHQNHQNHQNHHAHTGADHTAHAMNSTEHHAMNAATQAKLIAPGSISTNTAVPLTIEVQDPQGKAIANFETFQEKLMHLIVVSNDLEVFQHLHPTYQQNGRFTVETRFPQPGTYTLFTDYKPTGQNEQVSVLQTAVSGTTPDAKAISFDRTRKIGNTQASLTLSQPTPLAGQDVTVTFNLNDAATQQAVTDLQPYLGEAGHLVILRHASSLTKADYIHAHALPNTPEGQISFVTQFPQPGHYKLWGQFDRGGEMVVADFWVDVRPAP